MERYNYIEHLKEDINNFIEENKNLSFDELYDTMFSLLKRQPMFGAHPMIAACNVKHWIENYDWWLE